MALFAKTLPVDHNLVVAAIKRAELKSSGEIRVLVDPERAPDPVAVAKKKFDRLGMQKTALRNGVLIYVSTASRTFAIVGDTGIHEKCGDSFWKLVVAGMEHQFRRSDFTAGLIYGIDRAGAILAENFPRAPDDRNELPDDVAT
jgi:uncharacterized membrane protein